MQTTPPLGPHDVLGVIGLGTMAEAMVAGLCAAGRIEPSRVLASRRDPARLATQAAALGIRAAKSNAEVAAGCSVLLVATKPAQVAPVLAAIAASLRARVVVSVAAGVSTATMEAQLAEGVPVVRAMPNTPMLVGRGMSIYCGGRAADTAALATARAILEGAGRAVEIPEALMDAATAVSGSGPAYFFYLTECLADAGVALGLDRDVAVALAAETFVGAAQLLAARGEDPAKLRADVTSPGGVTQAALERFAGEDFAGVVQRALARAVERAGEIGRAAADG